MKIPNTGLEIVDTGDGVKVIVSQKKSKPLVGYPEAQETLVPEYDDGVHLHSRVRISDEINLCDLDRIVRIPTNWQEVAKKLADALGKMPCITSGHQKVKDEALQEYYKLKSI